MWEHREALGLTTTLSLEDLELHETAVLTIDAGLWGLGLGWLQAEGRYTVLFSALARPAVLPKSPPPPSSAHTETHTTITSDCMSDRPSHPTLPAL